MSFKEILDNQDWKEYVWNLVGGKKSPNKILLKTLENLFSFDLFNDAEITEFNSETKEIALYISSDFFGEKFAEEHPELEVSAKRIIKIQVLYDIIVIQDNDVKDEEFTITSYVDYLDNYYGISVLKTVWKFQIDDSNKLLEGNDRFVKGNGGWITFADYWGNDRANLRQYLSPLPNVESLIIDEEQIPMANLR